MTQTEAFLEMLRCWRDAAKPRITSYEELFYKLAGSLGCPWQEEMTAAGGEGYLRLMDERIYYLMNESNIAEDVLVNGLIFQVTRHLDKMVEEQAQTLSELEQIAEGMDELDVIMAKIRMLKDPGYHVQARFERDEWRKLTERVLS